MEKPSKLLQAAWEGGNEVASEKGMGGNPKKIECPRCHELFKPAGFAGHQQHSNCWLDARKARSGAHPEGSLAPAPFDIPPMIHISGCQRKHRSCFKLLLNSPK